MSAAVGWTPRSPLWPAPALPWSGERRILLLTASLADGIPVDLRDAVTGLDDADTARLITAIRHATGKTTREQPISITAFNSGAWR